MHILATDGLAAPHAYYLREGYAGEMKWSPDGSQLAISTYSLDRKEHNVYLLGSLRSNELRFLNDGCLIFWSPDGRFIVAKREPHDLGVAAIRVSDGLSWTVTKIKMTPASWGTDEAAALKLLSCLQGGRGLKWWRASRQRRSLEPAGAHLQTLS
jgi:hypothetical protein